MNLAIQVPDGQPMCTFVADSIPLVADSISQTFVFCAPEDMGGGGGGGGGGG